eukprot:9679682-Alexandrium_andersonii.AAC.1
MLTRTSQDAGSGSCCMAPRMPPPPPESAGAGGPPPGIGGGWRLRGLLIEAATPDTLHGPQPPGGRG